MQKVAFTGSRKGFQNQTLVSRVARQVHAAGHLVLVGCANGVDAVVRHSVPAQVFKVASPFSGTGSSLASALARRSISMVQACSVLVGFASVPCPSGVSPASHFGACGGSGTWASLAYAVSQGVRVFVFPAPGISLPPWAGGQWVQACPSGLWSGSFVWQPSATQLKLI
jgi:hypothetical protein